MLSLIAAIDENNAIGCGNRLLAYLPNDLRYFKRITNGHPVIMGRRTWESLPVKPLPGRRNIVVSGSLAVQPAGCELAVSTDDALNLCHSEEETFVIGGAQLYRQMIPFADKLYITRIHHCFDKADAFFPAIDANLWELYSSEFNEIDEQHPFTYNFEIFVRNLWS